MPKSVIIPITNVYAKGTYTAKVKIGSQTTRVNLILDTGSSALAWANTRGNSIKRYNAPHGLVPNLCRYCWQP